MDLICDAVLLSRDWDLLPRDRSGITGTGDLAALPYQISSYSEAALEYALRLKEQAAAAGHAPVLLAAVLAPELPEVLPQNLYAVGVDRLVHLPVREETLFSPPDCAELLAGLFAPLGPDLVLTGCQDSTCCGAEGGILLARQLGLPYYGPLADLRLEGGRLRLTRTLSRCTQEGSVSGPAVCAMGNCEHPYLRMATLREKLAVLGRAAERAEPACNTGRGPRLESLAPRQGGRQFRWLPGDTPEEQAAALLALIREKEGTP